MNSAFKEKLDGKEVGKVFMSYDYNRFTCLDRNRELNPANLKKLMESMKEEQLVIPIIVNQYYQIIDGQHRKESAEALGLPIYYIINWDYGIDQVIRANTVGVNWTKEDFLKSYVGQGIETYIELENIKEEYNLGIVTLLTIVSEFMGLSQTYIHAKFENGALKITPEMFGGIDFFLYQLELFRDYKGYKNASFIKAFLKLYMYEDFDPQQMIKQMKYMKAFDPKQHNFTCILEELCKKVYSFRVAKNKQLFFDVQRKEFYK